MHEWYVIDTRTGEILTCITSSRPFPPSVASFPAAQFLLVTLTPSQQQLDGYRYYRERP